LNNKVLQSRLNEIENYIIKSNAKSKNFDDIEINNLNDKIFELTEENKTLKNQILEIKSRESQKEESMIKIDRENIFTNNYTKEDKQRFKTILDCDTSYIVENYKTLEQRVLELERGLKKPKADRSRGSFLSEHIDTSIQNKSSDKKVREKSSDMKIIKQKIKKKPSLKPKEEHVKKINPLRNKSCEPIKKIKQSKLK
jgi:hypothetical protein